MNAPNHTPQHVLLADDDRDDQFLFKRAVAKLEVSVKLTIVEDGEELMTYLINNVQDLPNVLFLDLNMPRKNGAECLSEIKQNKDLNHLPVVIYSTAIPGEAEDLLYNEGAHYYVRKTDVPGIQKILNFILGQLLENKFVRATKKTFILTSKLIVPQTLFL